MFLQIEPQSGVPIYEQITNQVIEGIVRGNLNPGDMLPSVRGLAADLGVNMHTVNKSYHELENKGIIRIIPKSGAVISEPAQYTDQQLAKLAERLRPIIAEALVLGVNNSAISELVTTLVKKIKEA